MNNPYPLCCRPCKDETGLITSAKTCLGSVPTRSQSTSTPETHHPTNFINHHVSFTHKEALCV